jgi:hypothetical protein
MNSVYFDFCDISSWIIPNYYNNNTVNEQNIRIIIRRDSGLSATSDSSDNYVVTYFCC